MSQLDLSIYYYHFFILIFFLIIILIYFWINLNNLIYNKFIRLENKLDFKNLDHKFNSNNINFIKLILKL